MRGYFRNYSKKIFFIIDFFQKIISDNHKITYEVLTINDVIKSVIFLVILIFLNL